MIRTAGLMVCLLLTANASCTAWRVVPPPWPSSLEAKPAEGYRVHLADGRQLRLDSLRIVGDSLIGHHSWEMDDKEEITRYSVPVTDIPSVERAQDRGKYFGLGALIGAALGAAAGASSCESGWLLDTGSCVMGASLLGALVGVLLGGLAGILAVP